MDAHCNAWRVPFYRNGAWVASEVLLDALRVGPKLRGNVLLKRTRAVTVLGQRSVSLPS